MLVTFWNIVEELYIFGNGQGYIDSADFCEKLLLVVGYRQRIQQSRVVAEFEDVKQYSQRQLKTFIIHKSIFCDQRYLS